MPTASFTPPSGLLSAVCDAVFAGAAGWGRSDCGERPPEELSELTADAEAAELSREVWVAPAEFCALVGDPWGAAVGTLGLGVLVSRGASLRVTASGRPAFPASQPFTF